MQNQNTSTQPATQPGAEFNVTKWIWGTAISVVLSIVVIAFNVVVFGHEGALPYVGVVLFTAAVSIWMNKFTDSPDKVFRVAAFALKVAMMVVLAANAVYSLSVMRSMLTARKTDKVTADRKKAEDRDKSESREIQLADTKDRRATELAAHNKIMDTAGPQARREEVKRWNDRLRQLDQEEKEAKAAAEQKAEKLAKIEADNPEAGKTQEQIVFDREEKTLSGFMALEAILAVLAFFVLSGIKSLRAPSVAQPGPAAPSPQPQQTRSQGPRPGSMPTSLPASAAMRENPGKGHLRSNAGTVTRHGDASQTQMTRHGDASLDFGDASLTGPIDRIREALRSIAKAGHYHFKVEEKSSGKVLIRQAQYQEGREVYTHSATFNSEILEWAKSTPMHAMIDTLRRSLIHRKFDLDLEREGR